MTFHGRSAAFQKAAVPAAQVAIERALAAAAAEQAPAGADDVVNEVAGNKLISLARGVLPEGKKFFFEKKNQKTFIS
jgi:hypothetical protein